MAKRWWATTATAAVLGLFAAPSWAAEAIVDAFTDASAQTEFVFEMNVRQGTVGTTVRVDPNLSGVIGGVRGLDVTATAIAIPDLDRVIAGVVLPPVSFFDYASSDGADGNALLTYDSNGSGLNANLEFAQGISLTVLDASMAAVSPPGMDVTVTLVDGDLQMAVVTQTITMAVNPMSPLLLEFPFASFAGIDVSNLQSIFVFIDPQLAGEARFNTIVTYGTPLQESICDDGIDNNNNGFIDCRDQNCVTAPNCNIAAPALSSSGMGMALALVALIGLAAIGRLRRTDG